MAAATVERIVAEIGHVVTRPEIEMSTFLRGARGLAFREHAPQFRLRRPRVELMQPLDQRHPRANRLPVILRKVAHRDLVSPRHRAGIDRERLLRRIDRSRCVPHQRPQQRGLARAVAANESHLLAPADCPPHKKSPRLAPGASFTSRNGSYLLTAILACRSVGRTIGKGGLVTTSLTQRASPPLK